MNAVSPDKLLDVAADIESELIKLEKLSNEVEAVRQALSEDVANAEWLRESLALKLHNFYTGCERIFQIIATEMNGGLPAGNDWHLRLLDRMSQKRDRRIAVIQPDTARRLKAFLGFRHVVRHIYGSDIDPIRLTQLAEEYTSAHESFVEDARHFIQWLRELAEEEMQR